MSHYDWLNKHIVSFFNSLGLDGEDFKGMIVGAGDKCYGYEDKWAKAGICFEHGVAIYFLTYLQPWSKEVRETDKGFIAPSNWVIDNYPKFKDQLDELK